uniref:Uncharacterized protein n=1 Tax=Lutzomyia longipalpis TaxID=7200 RepID=A0A7G3B3S7_LUTLO
MKFLIEKWKEKYFFINFLLLPIILFFSCQSVSPFFIPNAFFFQSRTKRNYTQCVVKKKEEIVLYFVIIYKNGACSFFLSIENGFI